MALDAATIERLIRKLAEDRDNYMKSVEKSHELLIQALKAAGTSTTAGLPAPIAPAASTAPTANPTTAPAPNNYIPVSNDAAITSSHYSSPQTTAHDSESARKRAGSTLGGSTFEYELEDVESLFIKTPLDGESYDEEGLRNHIRTFPFNKASRELLRGVLANERLLQRKSLFPMELGELDDRSHFTHYSIFDVGEDGAPLPIKYVGGPVSRPLAIWRRLNGTNADPQRRKAVGKIVIVREPSPLLFAAIHYTMNKHFDMCHLYELLYHDDPIIMHAPQPFADDHRRQRTFTVALEYFTIIGDGCIPMQWQRAESDASTGSNIPLTRCASVTSLSLEGAPISPRLRNKDRRASKKFGSVFDPFSPWRVLSVQAYPDWKSSIDVHDGSKQYVNGPMAFMVTLRAELCDAYKRLVGVYRAIADLVEPPANFIFDQKIRDQLLFEDDEFTYSRRYFWAAQTLGIMNEDIRNIIDSYYDTFKDAVWDGSEKIIWPSGGSVTSARHMHWRKKMASLRHDLESEINKLKEVEKLNDKKIRFIRTLNDSLFSGTSVRESRHSVYLSGVTVAQGDNIRLLTLVTLLFLPLSFVTSVFGMTNLPSGTPFHNFAYVSVAICIPFWILVGSLSSKRGLHFWRRNTAKVFRFCAASIARILDILQYRPAWTQSYLGPMNGTYNPYPITSIPMRPSPRRTGSVDSARRAARALSNTLSPQATNRTIDQTEATTPEMNESAVSSNAVLNPRAEGTTSSNVKFHVAPSKVLNGSVGNSNNGAMIGHRNSSTVQNTSDLAHNSNRNSDDNNMTNALSSYSLPQPMTTTTTTTAPTQQMQRRFLDVSVESGVNEVEQSRSGRGATSFMSSLLPKRPKGSASRGAREVGGQEGKGGGVSSGNLEYEV